jgi:phenylalanyl-tRNA synthetase beta chain
MAIVNFELEDLAIFGIAKQDISNVVDRLGMSLEAMDEKSVSIDITPNRPDMLDIVGFARASSFILGKKVPQEKHYSIKNGAIMQVKVERAVKGVRPFIGIAIIKNANLKGNRLKNLINFTEKFCETYGRKRKKIAIGLHNLDVIRGPLTYTASADEEFIPLGYKTKMKFKDIIKKHEKGIEYSNMFNDGKKYPFLRDTKNILAFIPIINSELTRVTENTQNILIDVTGTSQNSVDDALALISCSFIDSKAEIYQCEVDYGGKKLVTPKLSYKNIKLKRTKAEKTLGVYMEENRIINLANRMGSVAAKYGSYMLMYVPPYRLDMFNEQDMIEDIAIAYGYDKIEPMPVVGVSFGLADESNENANRTSRLMIGMGFSEAINPYLTNGNLNFNSLGRKGDENSIISVAYAKTESITMLRTALIPWLMQNLGNSTNDKMPQRLFEIGKVFYMDGDNIVECTNLGIVSEHSKANYSEIKSVVEKVLMSMGAKGYELKELKDAAFIDGRAARIIMDNEEVGHFGEINPRVLENFKLEEPVIAAEIKFERCVSHPVKPSNEKPT